jgi:phosphonate transport system permease protein
MAIFAVVISYLAFSVWMFDLPSVARKWSPERATMFMLDTYAHKDVVLMEWDRADDIDVYFEAKVYEYEKDPDWFSRSSPVSGSRVDIDNGSYFVLTGETVTLHDWPGLDAPLVFGRTADGLPQIVGYENKRDQLPDWIRWTENKIEVRPDLYTRLQVFARKAEIHRYSLGWKYFWFDFRSPLADVSLFDAVGLMFSSDRVDPSQSNASLVFSEFWYNEIWFHMEIMVALLETLLMALLGTFFAALFGLPLAFLAAQNITPFEVVRFGLRRLFDLLRGIDMLIWSLIFLRAFGPGLFTGAFAIAFTDTGTLGKLMSEAIENADSKQQEGIRSTGAKKTLQHRFGILPQIMPIFISQTLYYFESNVRGAVIIGAMGAGGIGLQFLGAMQTGSDFENVAYMAILVLLMVIAIDKTSARLRRILIGLV